MLISFSVENYRSFAGEQTLSLEAVKDDTHPDHVVNNGRSTLLKSAAIYGSNASGKSNLLRAFSFMEQLVRTSATSMNLGDLIRGANYFRLDKTRLDKPCSFDIRVLLNGTEYQYGFTVTKERVCDEWLYVKREGIRSTNPLSRQFDSSTEKTDWKLQGELKGAHDLIKKTRDNCLFLSRAAEMNVDFVQDLFLWFKKSLWCLNFASIPELLIQQTARQIENNPDLRIRVEKLVHDADFGIDGLYTSKESAFPAPEDAPEEIRMFMHSLAEFAKSNLPRSKDGNEKRWQRYAVQTLHKLPDSEESVTFSLEDDESYGSQRFFGIIGPILHALDHGRVLIVDELDCSMHPRLTRKIVELFHSKETNPNGAQLIFATHDTNLMTPTLFRRDQIWITEKGNNGGTELYSLSDIDSKDRPRKEEPFEKRYLEGRYGGVPNFGPALEDL